MNPKPRNKPTNAFTFVELVVVILILAILAGVLVPRVTDRLATARDSQRLSDLRLVRDAIERYRLDKGVYPPATVQASGNGFDVSHDSDGFIPELVKAGYLRKPIADPLNDANSFYGYGVFEEASHGCKGKGEFYVLGIKRFETATFAAAHPGYFKCARKDWSADFEYVVGRMSAERKTLTIAATAPK